MNDRRLRTPCCTRRIPGARADGRAALQEQEAEKLSRREERVIILLNKAVEAYAYAKECFQAWQTQRANSKEGHRRSMCCHMTVAKLSPAISPSPDNTVLPSGPVSLSVTCSLNVHSRAMAAGAFSSA